MINKIKDIINAEIVHAVIMIIGVCIFGVSFTTVCAYFNGEESVTAIIGGTPLSFIGSILLTFTGLAIFLIGKQLARHDKIIRKV